MFLKVFLIATILCTLQHSVEVESFEIIKNALKNVATKVHNFVHPNHHHHEHEHNAHCHHSHDDNTISSTTPVPQIDIRSGLGPSTSASQTVDSDASSTVSPDDPDAIPDFASRTLIGAPCPAGTRSVNGNCRAIAG